METSKFLNETTYKVHEVTNLNKNYNKLHVHEVQNLELENSLKIHIQ